MLRSNLMKLLRISANKQFICEQQTYKTLKLCLPPASSSLCRCITSNPVLPDIDKEKEFLVKIRNDPDTFGSAAETPTEVDPDDLKEQSFLEHKPESTQKLSTKRYADIIKSLINKKKIKEAIDVVEIRMIKEDRVKPENYIYNLLLGACGRVGYTKKAFTLYNKMKQRGLKITPGTYTALFNACANSPWPEDGLSRAKHLRNIMIEKRYEANDTNYNAMIKAFGRCGDLSTAFQLVDEMSAQKIPVREDTLNFLLQSCISDKDAGFRHALLVWRKFIERRIMPDIYSFNLMLKCVKDCNLGDLEVTKDVIANIVKKPEIAEDSTEKTMISSGENNNLTVVMKEFETRPNLLAKNPHLGSIMSLSEVKNPEDRFLLIGGISGFLRNMSENHCAPDIKTFTQMLNLIPGTFVAEKELIASMKKANVKIDVDFYNMLIKKRSMRFDYASAREVLELMKKANLNPDIITYGVLALGCKTKEEAQDLIQEMGDRGYRMNPEILGAMLHQACYHYSFSYVFEVMETCLKEEIRPNKKFMQCLQEFKQKCKRIMDDNERTRSPSFEKAFLVFKLRYSKWLTEVDPIKDDEVHPWQQFRQTTETDVSHFKNKDRTSRFKPRHASFYKQKKREVIYTKHKQNKEYKKKFEDPNNKDAIDYVNHKHIEAT